MAVHVTPPELAEPPGAIGTCALSPAGPVVAGAWGTWTITYTAGGLGIAPGGGVAVVPPCHNGVRWRVGHVVASTTGRCGVSVRLKHCHPLSYHNQQFPIVFVTVEGGCLRPGEEIQVVLGDPGAFISGFFERARAQDLAMARAEFQVLVDPLGNARYSNPGYPGGQPRGYRLLPDSPAVDVVAGAPSRLVVVAPARVAPGEPFHVLVCHEDEYGNTCARQPGEVALGTLGLHVDGPSSVQIDTDSGGAFRAGPFTLAAADTAGAAGAADAATGAGTVADGNSKGAGGRPFYITAHSYQSCAAAVSNPVEMVPPSSERIFFGDLHAHAFDGLGGRPRPAPFAPHGFGSFEDAYRYARDVAGLDFVVLATFPRSRGAAGDDEWAGYQALTRRFHESGRFVPFEAIEVSDRGAGHRIVVFPGDGSRSLRSGKLPDLWTALEGTGALVIPHHTNASSEGGPQSWDVQDWVQHHPRFQPVVELTQNRGAFETDVPDGWDTPGVSAGTGVSNASSGATVVGGRGASVQNALALGCRLGFVGGTDNHYAQPGSNRCAKGGVDFRDRITGGLTAVFAPELTREAILAALWARRCYATTGARMLLDFQVDEHMMGEAFETAAEDVRLMARAVGDGPLARLEMVLNNAVVHTHRVRDGDRRVAALEITVPLAPVGAGATTYVYLRVTQVDGQVGWSSPVWVTRAG
ncbi:MAG: DUF3604 domain-containing protein [Chloroflexi bacterium]|nr:DUF3604 domain-containing protein [Chloroflexota bacterium]